MEKIENASAPPASLLQGYNSVTGNGLIKVMTGDYTDRGAVNEITCSVSETSSELARSLQIDQSLSVSFPGIGNLDQKLSFFRSINVTTFSVSVTVFARQINARPTLTNYSLNDDVEVPTNNEELDNFVRLYGDSFLSSVSTGGEYFGVYTFFSQTQTERSALVASLQASGIIHGGSVGVNLQAALESFLSTTTTSYNFQQMISGVSNPSFPEAKDMVEYALCFPSICLDAPVMIGMSTTGYEKVPQIGQVFDVVAKNRHYFTGATGVINGGLTQQLVQINDIHRQMISLESIYSFYGGYDDITLRDYTALAVSDMNNIKAQMHEYPSNATKEFPTLSLESIENGTPSLSYKISFSDPHGGNGGLPFNDVDIATYLQSQTRITTLQLRSNSRIDLLITTYQNNNGTWTTTHGSNNGDHSLQLQLLAGQFVAKVNGHAGRTIDLLRLESTSGHSISGGDDDSGEFIFTAPDNSILLGFRGRSGRALDRLQAVYAKFKDAVWAV